MNALVTCTSKVTYSSAQKKVLCTTHLIRKLGLQVTESHNIQFTTQCVQNLGMLLHNSFQVRSVTSTYGHMSTLTSLQTLYCFIILYVTVLYQFLYTTIMLTPTFGKQKSLIVFFSDAQNFAYRIVEVILNNDLCNITENLQSLISTNPGVHNPRCQVRWITKSCTLPPNTHETSIWNLLHTIHLAPRILRLPLHFWKFMHLSQSPN